MKWETFLATRFLYNRRGSILMWLPFLAVVLSVCALVVVLAVMTGFSNEMKRRLLTIIPPVQVTRKVNLPMDNWQSVREKILKIKEVTEVTPYIEGQAILQSLVGVQGVQVKGVPWVCPPVSSKKMELRPGEIMVGSELAAALGIKKGDFVNLITAEGEIFGFSILPRTSRFRVVKIFKVGVWQFDYGLVFVSLKDAAELFGFEKGVTGLAVKIKNIYRASDVAASIRYIVGPAFFVLTWIDLNRNLFAALKLEKTVTFIVLTLMILVASFGIASNLINMVTEKTKDIGILRAMGAMPGAILRIFLLSGVLIGLVGSFSGTALGVFISCLISKFKFINLPEDIYYITTVPATIKITDVFYVNVASFLITLLASLYPAWKGSRITVARALRYE